ncbi:MAG: hypothetical protein FWB99_07325, partial [Treponema sp.]|nr:hypothetical protein [Treponema sp.]
MPAATFHSTLRRNTPAIFRETLNFALKRDTVRAGEQQNVVVQIRDLWKTYPMGNLEVQALKGVDL